MEKVAQGEAADKIKREKKVTERINIKENQGKNAAYCMKVKNKN